MGLHEPSWTYETWSVSDDADFRYQVLLCLSVRVFCLLILSDFGGSEDENVRPDGNKERKRDQGSNSVQDGQSGAFVAKEPERTKSTNTHDEEPNQKHIHP